MPKKTGIVLVTLGAVLIMSALLLFISNQREAEKAGQEAEILMTELENHMREQEAQSAAKAARPDAEETEPDEATLSPELPVVEIRGYEYVGYVEIPSLWIKLPVLAEWGYDLLEYAPCRQFGSSRTDDLVIAAHNYSTHFGDLKWVKEGATVTFTDMDGIVNSYTVAAKDTVDPDDVDSVLNSGYDLVLYTCTYGGRTRVVVFCDRVEETDTTENEA